MGKKGLLMAVVQVPHMDAIVASAGRHSSVRTDICVPDALVQAWSQDQASGSDLNSQ